MCLSNPERDVDVLVVGAGPVGLTMANELVRYGLSCRIIDKNAQRTDKSKALVLWSRSLELLDAMGGSAPFLAAGTLAHGASMYSGGKRLVHLSFDGVESPHAYALMIPQSETERLLEERLAAGGLRVDRRVELTALRTEPGGVVASLTAPDGGEESCSTSWLVACDGAHSTVRHLLGLAFDGEVEPNDWILADVHLSGHVPDDEISTFLHREGALAFFPIVGGRFRVIADVGLARDLAHPPDPTLALVQEVVDHRGPGGVTLHDPLWLSGFRIHERKLSQYRRGRVLLAGDAAHVHSPAGGQGMNTGMQDAFNLGWKLALVDAGRARETLLDTYDAERGAVGDMVLRNAAALTRLATLRHPLAQDLRNRVVPLLAALDPVHDRLAATMSEVAIAYGSSPLSGEQHGLAAHAWLFGGGVPPGSRAPDVTLADAVTGAPLQLFDLLRGTKHTLLLLSGLEPGAAHADLLAGIAHEVTDRFGDLIVPRLILAGPDARRPAAATFAGLVLRDPALHMHRRYAAAGATIHLVRPDGYVGYRSQPAESAGLLAHLERYLLPQHAESDRPAARGGARPRAADQ